MTLGWPKTRGTPTPESGAGSASSRRPCPSLHTSQRMMWSHRNAAPRTALSMLRQACVKQKAALADGLGIAREAKSYGRLTGLEIVFRRTYGDPACPRGTHHPPRDEPLRRLESRWLGQRARDKPEIPPDAA
jgi:hypothetical protein